MKELVCTTKPSFITTATELLVSLINEAITARGKAVVGLSGGSTPRPIYNALSTHPGIDWSKVYLFLVDDRHVPPDHPDSNQRLLKETGLSEKEHVILPDMQVSNIPTKQHLIRNPIFLRPRTTGRGFLTLQNYQEVYAMLLRWAWEVGGCCLQYSKGDGHFASLFPPVPWPEAFDEEAWTVATTTESFAVKERVSLTLNPLIKARSKLFLLWGEDKRLVWKEMMEEKNPEYSVGVMRWPALPVIQSGGCSVVFGA